MESDRERYNRLHQYDQVVAANRKDVIRQPNGEPLKYIPLIALAFGVIITFLIAGLVAVARALYYLVDGIWVSSTCASTTALNAHIKFQLPDACAPVTTDWIGVNNIAQWLLRDLDASLLCLLVAFCLWLLLQVYMSVVK